MKLKINYHYIYIFLFTSFFFLWDVNILDFKLIPPLSIFIKNFNISQISGYKVITLNYFIILLLLPIFYLLGKKKNLSIYKIFKNQKHIILFVSFVIFHYFFTNILYNQIITTYEVLNLFFLIILSFIYCHYRNFLSNNFKSILFLYLIIFISFSFEEQKIILNEGQCNNKFFLINFIQNKFQIYLSNSFYLENSHLAMMMTGVIFSSMLIVEKSKKLSILFLFLFFLSIIITLLNYSTTFFITYLVCQVVIFIFFYKKISNKFWIYSFLFLLLNSLIFFSDINCTNKVTQFDVKNVMEKKIDKTIHKKVAAANAKGGSKNYTTLIYERSAVLTINTLYNQPFGWGNEGMDEATINLINKPEYKNIAPGARILNLKDGLSNFFKMINEFGFFSLLIFYLFIRYLLNLEKIDSYNLFIITLFITQCIRGAGYFNGGFIFCLLEFIYFEKFTNQSKQSPPN